MGCAMVLLALLTAASLAAGAMLLGTFALGVGLVVIGGLLFILRSRTAKRGPLLGVLSGSLAGVGLLLCLSVVGVTWAGAQHLREVPVATSGSPAP